ncbi:MAG: endonuclease III [Deltaproteobacteria bacterium]|nr:endonuclease III [Deltaproteobacteria bacterium]
MTKDNLQNKVKTIIAILEREYPDPKTALVFQNPLELLISTVLSAQCTDKRVNEVTKNLFQKYHRAKDYAQVNLSELESDIKPTGFFRNKAKSIKAFCNILVDTYHGDVPSNLDDMVSLPGIGRKTANVVLAEAYNIPAIIVDTHVLRLSNRIGLTNKKDATKVEFDLMEIIPKEQWRLFSNLLISHGRAICTARKPRHNECKIIDFCEEGIRLKD